VTQPPDHAVVVDAVPDDVKPIADAIRKNECVLFLGAGVHSRPPDGSPYEYAEEHRPLRGGELAAKLAHESRWDLDEKPQNLGRVALYSQIKRGFGRKRLIDEVRLAVHEGKQPSPALMALAELDFPMIATTNYDQLFEQALRAHGRKPSISIYKPERDRTDDYVGRAFPTPDAPFVVKLHGDIDRPESIVITDEDYIHFVLRMGDPELFHPVPQTLKFGLAKHVTLFIGYSLLDYNLRLLFKTIRWQVDKATMQPSYAVDPFPDRLIRNVYDDQGGFVQFIVLDVWSFVPLLYRELKGREMPSGQEVAR